MWSLDRRLGSVVVLAAAGALCAVSVTACKNGGSRRKSEAARWVDSPSPGSKDGKVIKIPDLGVQFEVPDTLYVYRDCGEASHAPEGAQKWVPVITCRSTTAEEFGFEDPDEYEEDPFAEEDVEEATGAESIGMTVYVTHKTRPLDERSIAWFENQYKQAGLDVDELSYQHDYQKKSGIYAKLHVVDDTGAPTREIIQFMFPRNDVVFIARMEYPFGETRSVEADWKYILWNFDWLGAGGDDEES